MAQPLTQHIADLVNCEYLPHMQVKIFFAASEEAADEQMTEWLCSLPVRDSISLNTGSEWIDGDTIALYVVYEPTWMYEERHLRAAEEQ